jgi:hypothetical protein
MFPDFSGIIVGPDERGVGLNAPPVVVLHSYFALVKAEVASNFKVSP